MAIPEKLQFDCRNKDSINLSKISYFIQLFFGGGEWGEVEGQRGLVSRGGGKSILLSR